MRLHAWKVGSANWVRTKIGLRVRSGEGSIIGVRGRGERGRGGWGKCLKFEREGRRRGGS